MKKGPEGEKHKKRKARQREELSYRERIKEKERRGLPQKGGKREEKEPVEVIGKETFTYTRK